MGKWEELDGPVDKAGRIAKKYEQVKMRTQGHLLLDFDDMLTIAERALRDDEQLSERFRSRYDYLLTDESQDTSLVQHQIVEHLVALMAIFASLRMMTSRSIRGGEQSPIILSISKRFIRMQKC